MAEYDEMLLSGINTEPVGGIPAGNQKVANPLFEMLPQLLLGLGGAIAPEGSPLQRIGGTISQAMQNKLYNQYLERKKIDPSSQAPIGLSPELRQMADQTAMAIQQQEFTQSMQKWQQSFEEKTQKSLEEFRQDQLNQQTSEGAAERASRERISNADITAQKDIASGRNAVFGQDIKSREKIAFQNLLSDEQKMLSNEFLGIQNLNLAKDELALKKEQLNKISEDDKKYKLTRDDQLILNMFDKAALDEFGGLTPRGEHLYNLMQLKMGK